MTCSLALLSNKSKPQPGVSKLHLQNLEVYFFFFFYCSLTIKLTVDEEMTLCFLKYIYMHTNAYIKIAGFTILRGHS